MCAGAGVDCGALTPVGHLGRAGLDRADSGQPGLTGRDRPAPAGPGRAGLPRLGAS